VELLKTRGELLLVVIPLFMSEDARNIATLTHNAYSLNNNYKYAGMELYRYGGNNRLGLTRTYRQ
jgi:hypothetical protein